MLWGIDVSHHQGSFDFAAARREGFDFAILKATEGSGFTDSRFAGNLAAARNAGLLTAAYHYQRGDSSAAAQLGRIRAVVPRSCPVILDVEANSGTAAVTRDLNARLNDDGYRTPLLYLPRWYWQQIGTPNLAGLPGLWSSRYPDMNGGTASGIYQRVPTSYWNGYGGLPVTVLQFTSSATVAGSRPVDCNAYPGTREQLANLFGGITSTAATPGGIEEMGFNDTFTDWAGNQQSVLSWMNHLDQRLNEIHHQAVAPGSVASRIPGDRNTTNVFDMIKDSTSWTNQTLGRVIALQAAGTTDPNAVADALRPVVADVVGPVVEESVTAALGADNQEQAEAIVAEISQRLAEGANHG